MTITNEIGVQIIGLFLLLLLMLLLLLKLFSLTFAIATITIIVINCYDDYFESSVTVGADATTPNDKNMSEYVTETELAKLPKLCFLL